MYIAQTLISCCIDLQMLKIIVVDRFHSCMQLVCSDRTNVFCCSVINWPLFPNAWPVEATFLASGFFKSQEQRFLLIYYCLYVSTRICSCITVANGQAGRFLAWPLFHRPNLHMHTLNTWGLVHKTSKLSHLGKKLPIVVQIWLTAIPTSNSLLQPCLVCIVVGTELL